jgi:hypothetical protein
MSKRANLYTGKAGQMAAMSEFLIRGWNVGMPEVDVGDDIFVVRDSDGDFHRVQVKTANATGTRAVSATYSFPLAQLRTPSQPELTYVLAVRWDAAWTDYIVMARRELLSLHRDGMGHLRHDRMTLRLGITETAVRCGEFDLSSYRNNWSRFPIIEH